MFKLANTLAIAAVITTATMFSAVDAKADGDKYQVGAMDMYIHDPSRPFDIGANANSVYASKNNGYTLLYFISTAFGGILTLNDVPEATQNNTVRTIPAIIFYPVKKNVNCQTPYTLIDMFKGDAATAVTFWEAVLTTADGLLANPEFIDGTVSVSDRQARVLAALQNTTLAECKDAPIAKGKFPVVFTTHGEAANGGWDTVRAKELVKNGYIVVALEHTGNPSFSMAPFDPMYSQLNPDLAQVVPPNTPYPKTNSGFVSSISILIESLFGGSQDLVDASFLRLDEAIKERRADIIAAHDTLLALNKDKNSVLRGHIEENAMGLMGSSYGGETALILGETLPFIKANAAFVAASVDYRPFVSSHLIGDPNSPTLANYLPYLAPEKPTIIQQADQDEIALGFVYSDRSQVYLGLKALLDTASGPIIFSILDDTNHGSSFISLEGADPDLVRNTYCDIYDNSALDYTSFNCIGGGLTYELKDPAEVESIWGGKVVDFFDLYLKHKGKACKSLISDEFAADGLLQEARNINCKDKKHKKHY